MCVCVTDADAVWCYDDDDDDDCVMIWLCCCTCRNDKKGEVFFFVLAIENNIISFCAISVKLSFYLFFLTEITLENKCINKNIRIFHFTIFPYVYLEIYIIIFTYIII